LHLAATDMELSLRSSVAAQVDGEGSVVVPGRLLVDLVRLLPDNEVTIEYRPDENVVHVTSGSSTSTLHTYAAEDFPRLPDLDAVGTFTVERQSLLDTVSRVSRSASRDESRPVLTGILVRFEAGKLVMAATDSYRLSVKETELSGEVPDWRRSSRRAPSASSHASRSPATTSSSACTRTRSSSPRTTCG
jgi:DNA polymerase sliding clamp subunit (PCNA homolog)